MSNTLITVYTESLLTAAAFRPYNIYFLTGTKDGELAMHEIKPPEQEPSGSFDSDTYDVENKYNLHHETIAQISTGSAVRSIKWTSDTTLIVGMRDRISLMTFDGRELHIVKTVKYQDISALFELRKSEERFVFPKLKFSKNPKTRALQKAVFEPLRHEKLVPYALKSDAKMYVLGTDAGEIIFYDLASCKEIQRFHDCGDYVSAIDQVDDIVVCSSGDGTVYLYRIVYENGQFSARLEDNSMPEETDFQCMQMLDDLAFVGTVDGVVLVYDIANIITHKHMIQVSRSSIESLLMLPGNVLLAATDEGSISIISVFPNIELLGNLAVVNCANGYVLTPNDDFSLLLVGGGDTKLNVEDMQWYVEEFQKKTEKAPEEEKFEQEEEEIELSKAFSDYNSGEGDESSSTPSSLADSSGSELREAQEVGRTDSIAGKKGAEQEKLIRAGHLSDDSSFSDFFKPIAPEKAVSKKYAAKKRAYSTSVTRARRQAFFKEIDSDSQV